MKIKTTSLVAIKYFSRFDFVYRYFQLNFAQVDIILECRCVLSCCAVVPSTLATTGVTVNEPSSAAGRETESTTASTSAVSTSSVVTIAFAVLAGLTLLGVCMVGLFRLGLAKTWPPTTEKSPRERWSGYTQYQRYSRYKRPVQRRRFLFLLLRPVPTHRASRQTLQISRPFSPPRRRFDHSYGNNLIYY